MEAFADLLYDIPKDYHHIFDIAHFILCVQSEKNDFDEKDNTKKKQNPFSLWLSSMMVCFAGGLLVAPLTGESALDAVGDPLKLSIATIIWYLIFYQDIIGDKLTLFPVKLPLYLLKGLYYPKKIWAGIKQGKKLSHGNVISMLIIAVLKGNGSGFMKPFARLVRGSSKGFDGLETLKPSLTTKCCLISALLSILMPGDLSYILMTGLLIGMKVSPLFNIEINKPINLIEEKISEIIFKEIKLESSQDNKKAE